MTSVNPNNKSPFPDDREAEYMAVYQDYYKAAAQARLGEWDDLRTTLKRHNPFKILEDHFLLSEVFLTAANAGKADIMLQMYDQGYTLEVRAASFALHQLAATYKDVHAEAVVFLAKNAGALNADFISKVAGSGSLPVMKVLKNAGCNILFGNTSFFESIYKHQPEMIKYLYQEGADLYAHANIVTQRSKNPALLANEKVQKTLAVYRELIEDDTLKFRQIYPDKIFSLDDFRKPPENPEQSGMPLMHIAARAGFFSRVVDAALKEKQTPLTAADLLREDAQKHTVLDILILRGELPSLFDIRLWHAKTEEAAALHAELQKYEIGNKIDIASFIAEAKQYHLKQQTQKNRLILKRPQP